MLQLMSMRVIRSLPAKVLQGATIAEEGLPLVWVREPSTGEAVLNVSTGAAGERFAGPSMSRNHPPRTLPRVERFTVPANGSVILARTPLTNQISYVDVAAHTAIDKAEVAQSGNGLEFDAALVGHVVDVIYRYEPTVEELRTVIGDLPFGGNVFAATGSVNRLVQGEFGTNAFDASADWTNAVGVKLGAGVYAPASTNADAIPSVQVLNTPSIENAFLRLAINIA